MTVNMQNWLHYEKDVIGNSPVMEGVTSLTEAVTYRNGDEKVRNN